MVPTPALAHLGFPQGIPLTTEHRKVGLTLTREKASLGWFMLRCTPTESPSLGSPHLGVQELDGTKSPLQPQAKMQRTRCTWLKSMPSVTSVMC